MESSDRIRNTPLTSLLPFVSLPHLVSVARLRTALHLRPPSVDLARAGTFIHNGDEVWSFTPLPILMSALELVVDLNSCHSRSHSEINADTNARDVLSWLLRKHFEQFLWRFTAHGLVVDTKDPSSSRAFFRGHEGAPREISYSIKNHHTSRMVVVYTRRGRRPNFRNEGFGFHVRTSGDNWAVAIEPFFLFTGPDATKPLPYAQQIANSEHYNTKAAIKNMNFWVDFLTNGEALIDLRDTFVDNLFLGRPG